MREIKGTLRSSSVVHQVLHATNVNACAECARLRVQHEAGTLRFTIDFRARAHGRVENMWPPARFQELGPKPAQSLEAGASGGCWELLGAGLELCVALQLASQHRGL